MTRTRVAWMAALYLGAAPLILFLGRYGPLFQLVFTQTTWMP